MALLFNCILELPIYEVNHFLFRFISVVYYTNLLFYNLDVNLGIVEKQMGNHEYFPFHISCSEFGVSDTDCGVMNVTCKAVHNEVTCTMSIDELH